MTSVINLLKEIELHDSHLKSVTVNGDGKLDLFVDIDEVWNKSLDSKIKGIRFVSVYEISDFKIDRLNIISSVEIVELKDYDKTFVVQENKNKGTPVIVNIEFVAGGNLQFICKNEAIKIF